MKIRTIVKLNLLFIVVAAYGALFHVEGPAKFVILALNAYSLGYTVRNWPYIVAVDKKERSSG